MQSQVKKKVKNDTLPPVRVGEARKAKFLAMCKESGGSQSSVLRDLVDNGKVEVFYNGKEVMRYVAEVHRKLNQYSLKMAADIQIVKNDIQCINAYLQNKGIESEVLQVYLARASLRLDDFQNQYNEQITICNRVLPVKSDMHGNI